MEQYRGKSLVTTSIGSATRCILYQDLIKLSGMPPERPSQLAIPGLTLQLSMPQAIAGRVS